jgi:hypothetical protein
MVPENLAKTTTSPTSTFVPSRSPIATTSAVWGSSLAVSGRTIPEAVRSSLSTGFARILSLSGLNFVIPTSRLQGFRVSATPL